MEINPRRSTSQGARPRVWPYLWCALALPALLAACTPFDDEPPPPCPATSFVPEARSMIRFAGEGRDLTDVVFEARIQDLAIICEYDDDVVEADLRVRILVVDGPANLERKADLSYFVALATRDQTIVAREEFDLEVPFEGNLTRILAVEEVSPRIPLRPGESGANYIVFVGLALTAEEYQYNRENR